ncbi:hypothetical protein Pmani_023636 [Petrolisthes manimaculis]|uniref:Fucosyltransferase n=1 Tax=Petrolisthes manimaculis TaxID=1843537 RepID=A0AAE1P955_9EUCA|nr:hypothetical protein Pmani_023636 [Petrolisthes manimaculis]
MTIVLFTIYNMGPSLTTIKFDPGTRNVLKSLVEEIQQQFANSQGQQVDVITSGKSDDVVRQAAVAFDKTKAMINPADQNKAKVKTNSVAHSKPSPIKAIAQSPEEVEEDGTETWKTILFWSTWFGSDWSGRFGTTNATELRLEGCPSWQCRFTYNRNLSNTADSIIFNANGFKPNKTPNPPRPWYQRWVWVNVESQLSPITKSRMTGINNHHMNHLLNWTMTHHSGSDVVAFYGKFLSLKDTTRPLRPNLMSHHEKTLKNYMKDLKGGRTLEDVMGPSWSTFVKRPKIVAWMSSHCRTQSRREAYVMELQKYMSVGTYGRCGTQKCRPAGPLNDLCWRHVLSTNYSFYLSMENSMCEDYITEKLYNPLQHNLVPVVYGGADYTKYLPPHSYINALDYHPRDLAALLTRLHNDPVEYGRYHLWRGYFTASHPG